MLIRSGVPQAFRYGASFRSNSALASEVPETIFTGATNTTGAVIHSLLYSTLSAGENLAAVGMKAGAVPALSSDLDVITLVRCESGKWGEANAPRSAVLVPAGWGLYRMSRGGELGASITILYTFK